MTFEIFRDRETNGSKVEEKFTAWNGDRYLGSKNTLEEAERLIPVKERDKYLLKEK